MVNVNQAIRVRYHGHVYRTQINTAIETPKVKPKKAAVAQRHVTPHLLHGSDEWKKIWHYESYADSLAFL
ncbi:MAG: hypothetical protein FWD16_05945 [Clostridia bacterium]|nr:hypothetical protein [Clostridia bacterium]